jgi:cobalamin biosynthesis protein CobT
MDPHEDLVRQNRAHIDAHQSEIVRLASDNPDAGKQEVFPEDQAVLDAKKTVEEAQTNLISAQQAAYVAKTERADAAAKQADQDRIDAEKAGEDEKASEENRAPLSDQGDAVFKDDTAYDEPMPTAARPPLRATPLPNDGRRPLA